MIKRRDLDPEPEEEPDPLVVAVQALFNDHDPALGLLAVHLAESLQTCRSPNQTAFIAAELRQLMVLALKDRQSVSDEIDQFLAKVGGPS